MKEYLKTKHEAIREKYHKLYKQGLRDEVIVERLAKEFFYSQNTVRAIVWGTGAYGYLKKEGLDLNANS